MPLAMGLGEASISVKKWTSIWAFPPPEVGRRALRGYGTPDAPLNTSAKQY